MAGKDSAKGNPAHKRIGNEHRKRYRKALWSAQEKKKDARRKAQAAAESRNKARGYTTWDEAKKARAAARA